MGQINPFMGVLPASPQAQSVRADHIRRLQSQARNATAGEPEETQVESPDAVLAIDSELHQQSHQEKEQHPKKEEPADSESVADAEPRLDVTA